MAYCNEADVEKILADVEFLKRGEEFDVSTQIAAGQAWMDAYLETTGVKVPMTTVPTFIRDAVANYVCYLLVRRVNTAGEFTDLMDEFRREAYQLKDDFASGLADIPGEAHAREAMGLPTVVNPHAD